MQQQQMMKPNHIKTTTKESKYFNIGFVEFNSVEINYRSAEFFLHPQYISTNFIH